MTQQKQPAGQPVSPLQLSGMVVQHLILSELMKISDILSKKEPAENYDAEIQKRVKATMAKMVRVSPEGAAVKKAG